MLVLRGQDRVAGPVVVDGRHQAAAQVDVLVRGLPATGGYMGPEKHLAVLGVNPQRECAAGLDSMKAIKLVGGS